MGVRGSQITVTLLVVLLTLAGLPPQTANAQTEESRAEKRDPQSPLEFPEPEIVERIALRNTVLQLLIDREYDELTRLAKDVRTTKARFTNGSWKLRAFYDAFSQLGHSPRWFPVAFDGKDPDWDAILTRLAEWKLDL